MTDKIVASRDDRVRGHFGSACQHIEVIRNVMWVNPVVEEESCIVWLKQGAPVELERQLGFRQGER